MPRLANIYSAMQTNRTPRKQKQTRNHNPAARLNRTLHIRAICRRPTENIRLTPSSIWSERDKITWAKHNTIPSRRLRTLSNCIILRQSVQQPNTEFATNRCTTSKKLNPLNHPFTSWLYSHRAQNQWEQLEMVAHKHHLFTALSSTFRTLRTHIHAHSALTTQINNRAPYQAFTGFIQTTNAIHSAISCIDTLSEVNMISPDYMHRHQEDWMFISPPAKIVGAGNQTSDTHGEIEFKYSFIHNGKQDILRCIIVKLPKGIDIVIGLPAINQHHLIPDTCNHRIYSKSNKETIRMDSLKNIRNRHLSQPIHVLSICGGIETPISVLLGLGFNISTYKSIEISDNARAASSIHYPPIIHLKPHDLLLYSQSEIDKLMTSNRFDIIFAGFPCQDISRINDNCTGDLTLCEIGATLIRAAAKRNPAMCIFIENVIPHDKLGPGITERLDQLYGIQSQTHNALKSGAPASRPRIYWISPTTIMETMPIINHLNPNMLLENGWISEKQPPRCIVASMHTRESARNYAIHATTGNRREFLPDEIDRFNPGLATGITNGYGTLDFSAETRQIGSGNAFSSDELWQITRRWPVDLTPRSSAPRALSTMYDSLFAKADALELFYLQMNDTEMWDYMVKKARNENLEMPLLHLTLHDNETIPFQTKAPGIPPPRLAPSADYCVDRLIADGSHQEVEYSYEFWICLLFFKAKNRTWIAEFDGMDGTYSAGDELQCLRPLKDQRVANSALKNPTHWAEHSPDRESLSNTIPADTAYFMEHDAANAYHDVKLTTRSRIYCVSQYTNAKGRRRYIQSLGGSQGLAAMGTFFPSWIRFGYCFFFALHWIRWWIQFIDDSLAHAPDEIRTINRHRMLTFAQRIMGLTPSPKLGIALTPSRTMNSVGMHWSPAGISLPDEAIQLLSELLMVRPKSITDARRLRGVILQSISAFDLNLTDKQRFNRLMVPLNDAITTSETGSSNRLQWSDQAQTAMDDLANSLTNLPRKYHDPSWVLSEDRCLAAIGDADPNAVAGYLVSVKRSDARDITIQDLLDPEITVLLAFHPKILSKGQRKWHILEKEIFVMIHLHRKTHQFINQCILPFATTEPAVPKLLYVSDNKAALRIRMGFHVPDAKCEYLTAKFQRATGWSEETAFTRHWPTAALDLPGESNNLADLACRFVNLFADRLLRPINIPRSGEHEDEDPSFDDFKLTEHHPRSLHVYFEVTPPCSMATTRSSTAAATGTPFGMSTNTPDGFTIHIFPLSPTEWTTVSSSYSKDTSEYNSVSIADLFSVATSNQASSNMISKRVNTWLNKVFYVINIATSNTRTVPILFTPSSSTKPALQSATDYTTHLVMVIPHGLKINFSNRSEDSQFYSDACEEWAHQNTTISDILWLAHDSTTPHNSQANTLITAKRMAWWNNMEADVQKYISWCSICSCRRLRLAPIGIGTRCMFPLLSWQIDDKIITDDTIIKYTGYVSIMTMSETTSGLVLYGCRKTAEAWEAAHLIYTRIVAYYGVPLQLISDKAKDYVSEVAHTLCGIMGIQNRISCSKGSHCKTVECKHRTLTKMLDQASAKGDLRSPIHLELYVAQQQIKENQLNESDNSTVFERLHGFQPITTADLLKTPMLTEAQLLAATTRSTNPTNTDYLTALHNRCTELIAFRSEMSDKRAKWNLTNRLSHRSNMSDTTTELKPDDEVSMDGNKWLIQRIIYSPDGAPMKALLTDEKDKCRWVRHDQLTPLSVPVHQNILPFQPRLNVGDTIFYYDSESADRSRVCCGDIVSITDSTVDIHVRQHNETARTWLPRWTNPLKPNLVHRHNYGKQKSNMIPFRDTTTRDHIICVAHLSEAAYLDDETAYYLRSKGIDISIAEDPEL